MSTYYGIDRAVDAMRAVLCEHMDGPHSARVRDFTDEQVAAGELRAADEECRRLNREIYRRAVTAAFEAVGLEIR